MKIWPGIRPTLFSVERALRARTVPIITWQFQTANETVRALRALSTVNRVGRICGQWKGPIKAPRKEQRNKITVKIWPGIRPTLFTVERAQGVRTVPIISWRFQTANETVRALRALSTVNRVGRICGQWEDQLGLPGKNNVRKEIKKIVFVWRYNQLCKEMRTAPRTVLIQNKWRGL